MTAAGNAQAEWIRESQRLAPFIPGVVRFDASPLVDSQIRQVGQELSASPLLFVRGRTAFEAAGEQLLAAHLERIRRLDLLAQLGGQPYIVEVVGHADGDGSPATNDSLSVSRANLVRSAIEGLRLSNIRATATGMGSRQPVARSEAEADKRANRRVTLRLVPSR